MIERPFRLLGKAALVLTVTSVTLLTPNSGGPAEATSPYTGDVPIAWHKAKPPQFWACVIGVSDDPSIQADAQNMFEQLTGRYGAAQVQVRRDQGGTDDPMPPPDAQGRTRAQNEPTWVNIQACINFIKGNANNQDVALFYISTHGDRVLEPAGPPAQDEPAGEGAKVAQPASPFGAVPFRGLAARREGTFVAQDMDVTDDQVAAALAGFAPQVGVIVIFDHCFSGEHLDGSSDTPSVLGGPYSILAAGERELECYSIDPLAATAGNPAGRETFDDPYAPVLLGPVSYTTNGIFTYYLLQGMRNSITPNGACVNRETLADEEGDNNCITTAVELFKYAAENGGSARVGAAPAALPGRVPAAVADGVSQTFALGAPCHGDLDGRADEDPPGGGDEDGDNGALITDGIDNDCDDIPPGGANTDEAGEGTDEDGPGPRQKPQLRNGPAYTARPKPTRIPTTPPAAVGGMAELPDIDGATLLETAGSSAPDAGVLTGAVAAGAVALGCAAWYSRRRWAGR